MLRNWARYCPVKLRLKFKKIARFKIKKKEVNSFFTNQILTTSSSIGHLQILQDQLFLSRMLINSSTKTNRTPNLSSLTMKTTASTPSSSHPRFEIKALCLYAKRWMTWKIKVTKLKKTKKMKPLKFTTMNLKNKLSLKFWTFKLKSTKSNKRISQSMKQNRLSKIYLIEKRRFWS